MKYALGLLLTVMLPFGRGYATPQSAAEATANSNPLCTLIEPFYWEIGDAKQAQARGSVGVDSNGQPILATTKMSVASASKLIYGTYVVQLRGGVDQLKSNDISFLHFTAGYVNIGNFVNVACPSSLNPDTVNQCLTMTNVLGIPYDLQTPADIGVFAYDGGQMENHAAKMTGLGNVDVDSLGTVVQKELGIDNGLKYSEPLMSGGITATTDDYVDVLRRILSGELAMHDALGTSPVCTKITKDCRNSVGSPIPENWHYSIGHWVEDDPATNGDGAFSSPGEYGYYPWIGPKKRHYGVIARSATAGANGIPQQGYASAQCGRLIRRAFQTGVQQKGSVPE